MTDINEQVGQNPTAPEPTSESKGNPQGEPKDEKAMLLDELRNLGIDNPEKLHGMANASQQAGKAWNQVGDLRRMNEELQSKLDKVLSGQQAQNPYDEPQSVDLASLIDSRLDNFWDRQTKKQEQAAERYYQEMGKIKSHPRYTAVGKMFESHVNNPDVAMKLRQGQTTLTDEFHNVVFAFQDELLKRSYKTLEGGQPTPGNNMPPHVEGGDTHTVPNQTNYDERQEKIKKTIKARQEGTKSSDDALHDLVNSFLPLDDPLLRA